MSIIQASRQPMAPPDPALDFRLIPIDSIAFPHGLYDATKPPSVCEELLQLPLIVTGSAGGLVVIDGCKRLARARLAGLAACNCGVLSPSPDERGTALMRIRLNRYRPIPLHEKYLFVKWLKGRCEGSLYDEACMQFTNDKNKLSAIEKLTLCSSPVVDAVFSGSVELSFATDIDRLDSTDRQALLALFGQFSFSRQMQKELIDWLPELAFREKNTISEILASSWVQEITEHDKLNGPQKIETLRRAIFDRRFPTIAKAKKVWAAHAAMINPDPSRVVFKPSEAFEKNRLEIKITITSPEQAKVLFSQLSEFAPAAWDKLIYPAQLFGEF